MRGFKGSRAAEFNGSRAEGSKDQGLRSTVQSSARPNPPTLDPLNFDL
jgi:hypothetical protein